MDNATNNLSFDQLPKAVGELLTKVDYVISRLDEKKDADGASPSQDDDQMMTMEEACQFIGKKRSTMYSLTSPSRGQIAYVLLTRSPLCIAAPLDLHV